MGGIAGQGAVREGHTAEHAEDGATHAGSRAARVVARDAASTETAGAIIPAAATEAAVAFEAAAAAAEAAGTADGVGAATGATTTADATTTAAAVVIVSARRIPRVIIFTVAAGIAAETEITAITIVSPRAACGHSRCVRKDTELLYRRTWDEIDIRRAAVAAAPPTSVRQKTAAAAARAAVRDACSSCAAVDTVGEEGAKAAVRTHAATTVARGADASAPFCLVSRQGDAVECERPLIEDGPTRTQTAAGAGAALGQAAFERQVIQRQIARCQAAQASRNIKQPEILRCP